MFAVKIARGRSRRPKRFRVRVLGAGLLLACAAHPVLAQRSAFPPACTYLVARSHSTANGPDDELRFDTERIQAALDACPAGEAVELEATRQNAQEQDAFLIAPLRLPRGVTLLIDAGVTVFASRRAADYRGASAVDSGNLPCGNLPCRALIEAEGTSSSFPSAIDGFGALAGRGSAPLLGDASGTASWADFAPAQRPALIHATDSFELRKVTLRDAPATALQLSGRGTVTIEGAKFVASATTATTHGIVQSSPDLVLVITNSTFAQSSSAIETAAPNRLTLNGVEVHSGFAFVGAPARVASRCVQSGTPAFICLPAALPLYSGEVFLSSSDHNNLLSSPPDSDLTLHVVLSPTEPNLPPASSAVTIYDGASAIGTVTLDNGLATLKLPALDPTHTHILTARADSSSISFGPAQATIETNISTLALSASATHATFNTPVDLSASATPNSATGMVSFYDGATLLGQTPLASGTAAFTETQLTPGTHTLTAHYAGDSADAAADSPPLGLRIDQAPSNVAVLGLPRSAAYGTLRQAAVIVSPAAATGSVALTDSFTSNGQTSVTALGSVPVSNGAAVFPLSNLAVGIHTLTAVYGGDQNYAASNTAPATVTITTVATTLALSTPQSSLVNGASATFSAILTPTSATGTVTFRDSVSGVLGAVTVVNGRANLNTSGLGIGTHSISASYSGDANNSPTISPSLTLTVNRTPSTLLLAPMASSLSPASQLSLTATLSPASATGVVTFSTSSGITLGQSTLTNGSASVSTNSLSVGIYSILASYSGDSVTAPSTSQAQTIQVGGEGTATRLSSSVTSAAYGSVVSLAANVSPVNSTGSITFSDAALGPLGSAPLSNGQATLNLSNLSPGDHILKAIYPGDSSHSSSTSETISVSVTPAKTTTQLSLAERSIPAGSPVVFNVQVTTQPSITATGTVQIRSGNRVVASGQLSASLAGTSYITLSIPSATLGAGAFSASASYSGDSFNAGSTTVSNAAFTIVGASTQATLNASASEVVPNTPVLLTARVTANAAATPSGAISFLDNGTVFATVPLAGDGSASSTFSPARPGLQELTATYAGTGIFAPSSSASIPLNVTPPVALTLAPASLSASANSTHTVALTIAPLTGYSGALRTTCSSPAFFIACTVSAPSTLQSTPLQATVQIKIAKDLASNATLTRPFPLGPALAFAGLLPLAGLKRKSSRRRLSTLRGAHMLSIVAAALLLSGTLSGCALGGNFFTVPPGPQSVTVSVVAAGTTVTTSLQVDITQ